MSEPPLDEGAGAAPEGAPDQPAGPGSPDYSGAPAEPPRRGAHRAGARPTPPPPPTPGAPLWPMPDYQPPVDQPVRKSRGDAMAARLLWGGVAVIAVIAIIALFNYFIAPKAGEDSKTAAATATPHATTTPSGAPQGKPTGGPTHTSSAKPTKTTKATAHPTTKAKPKPTAKPTAKPTPKATPVPTAKPKPKPTTPPTTAPPANVKAPLLVLNNSRIHGLALAGAAAFRKAGWTVTGTGNFHGRLPETTVYYSPGDKAAAETLARTFPGVTAIKPKPAGIPGSDLTVVLTRYFRP